MHLILNHNQILNIHQSQPQLILFLNIYHIQILNLLIMLDVHCPIVLVHTLYSYMQIIHFDEMEGLNYQMLDLLHLILQPNLYIQPLIHFLIQIHQLHYHKIFQSKHNLVIRVINMLFLQHLCFLLLQYASTDLFIRNCGSSSSHPILYSFCHFVLSLCSLHALIINKN